MGEMHLVPQVAIQGSLTLKENGAPIIGEQIFVSLSELVPDPDHAGYYFYYPVDDTVLFTDDSGHGAWMLSFDRPDAPTEYWLEYFSNSLGPILATAITVDSASFTRPADIINLTTLSGTVVKGGVNVDGQLYVVSQPAATMEDLYSQMPVGRADINDAVITGLVGVSSGYVVVFDDSDNGYFYITPSQVSLSGPLTLNLANMTRIPITPAI
jgi:hypothetical protein